MTWNTQNGLLESVTDALGASVQYTYDDEAVQYVTQIDTSGDGIAGYTTKMVWNYLLGVNISQTDANNLTQTMEYDEYGRMTALYTPYDEDIPAVSYEYDHPDGGLWSSRTYNKVSTDSENEKTISTYILIDGLGRAVLSAKTGVVTDIDGDGEVGWNVSGTVAYDSKGRTVKQGQPVFVPGEDVPLPVTMKNPTSTEYDILDRPLCIILPDESEINSLYTLESGEPLTITSDPEANITETLTDVRGRITSIRKKDEYKNLLMRTFYDYDIMGQLLEVSIKDEGESSSAEYVTSFSYDQRGLNLSRQSADSGLVTMIYDEVGHLYQKVDANLRETGDFIEYQYDGLGRLVTILYPEMTNVTYVYGDADEAANYAAGRLLSRTDESGTIFYEYGKMGEIIGEERTLNRLNPTSGTRSATIGYQSNYLGQMESVTYPDKEVISYEYDEGGQVVRVVGTRDNGSGTATVFVENIGYDEFGQRIYLEYGNGDITTYQYDEDRRWLSTLTTENSQNKTLQNLSYLFDDVGNVVLRTDSTRYYTSTQKYGYDDLYQLTSAEGTYVNKPSGYTQWKDEYTQKMSYDGLGNLTEKVSEEKRMPSTSTRPLNYELTYVYDEERPHLATQIGSLYYSYDLNGNLIEESVLPPGQSSTDELPNLTMLGDVYRADQGFGLVYGAEDEDDSYERTFSWDEENRLKIVLSTNGTNVKFLYDADGQRTTKYAGNGSYVEGVSGETLYFNEWWTETEDSGSFRKAKHIYLGAERVVTRLSHPDAGMSYENNNTYYYHPDHLGSAHCITDAEGNPYERIEYTPYGEMWIEIQEDDNTAYLNYIPFRFTSKEWDSETGLYYYGARYYEPKFSRWMSADPAGFELINPMGSDGKPREGYSMVEATNWYSYVANNPVIYVDPTGLKWEKQDDGDFLATEDTDHLAEVAEAAGYDSWQEAAEANFIDGLYDEEGNWLGGDSSLEGITIISKDNREAMDNASEIHIAEAMAKEEFRCDLKFQSRQGLLLMAAGLDLGVGVVLTAYLGKGGKGTLLGLQMAAAVFADGANVHSAAKAGVAMTPMTEELLLMLNSSPWKDVGDILSEEIHR